MKRSTTSLVLTAYLLVVALLCVGYQGFHSGGSLPLEARTHEFEVPEGADFGRVCRLLESEGLLPAAGLFRLAGRLSGADREIRAGWYHIAEGTAPGEILETLRAGPNVVIRVTVPEGLWLTETAEILSSRLELDREEILRAARDESLVARLGLPGPTLEGYLFPETYLFFRGEDVESVLAKMAGRFRQVIGPEEQRRAAELGLTTREAVTLASIVEAEALVSEELPRISAVFHNRLRLGWRLQADPTVQYARGTRGRLLRKHLAIDSPYNTYRIDRLPPGPICSPGAASIRAALYPTEGSKELYFVASREGGRHIFSMTGREHNQARALAKSRTKSP